MSRKKRDRALDDIKAACEHYINGELQDRLREIAADLTARTGIPSDQLIVEPNPDDSQSLLIRYPTATADDAYIEKVVKIEPGFTPSIRDIPVLPAIVEWVLRCRLAWGSGEGAAGTATDDSLAL